jgi:UDP-N-acetyl-2-amino-2-deoxyglucuronate dehydrogenase
MPDPSSTLRVAVVGCGDISAVHIDALRAMPGVDLVAVCDVDPARAERAAAAAVTAGRTVHAHTDLHAMLDAEHLDAVTVCTPHDQHVPVAIAALERGVHVLTEKPLAHDLVGAEELLEAAATAATAGPQLGVCFQNRYNEPVAALKRMLDDDSLGRPLQASATVIWHRTPDYYEASPWRGSWEHAGGGLLMNQAIHTLDLAQWLLGDVVRVDGSAATRLLGDVIEVEDTAEMLLTHDTGATTAFYATLAHGRNAPVDIEIVTERALVTLRDDLTVTWADGRIETVATTATAEGARAYWGVSHAALITDFMDSIRSGRRFWIDGLEAAKTLRIIQSVYDTSFPARPVRRMATAAAGLRTHDE